MGPAIGSAPGWDAIRQKKDVVIEMNAGAGKTLIGVLIAQSLVNETAGQVLYVCPTIQLIEQARMRAEECGLEVATMRGPGRMNRPSVVPTLPDQLRRRFQW